MDKIKALNLAKDCYSMKLELLTNATVVDDAIRFVQSNRNTTSTEHANDEIMELKGDQSVMKKMDRSGLSLQSSDVVMMTVNKIF